MNILKSKGFLVAVTVFLLVSVPITTYVVLRSEQTTRVPQASTVCQTNCTDLDREPDAAVGLKGDLNSDGVVNGGDLALVLTAVGKKGTLLEDLNDDGVVDESDVAFIKANWSKSVD